MSVPPAARAGTRIMAETACAESSTIRPALVTRLYAVLSTGVHELIDIP